MRKLTCLVALALLALGATQQTNATLIELGTFTTVGPIGNETAEGNFIESQEGHASDFLTSLGKVEVAPPSDTAPDFSVTFAGPTATVTWGDFSGIYTHVYFLVKDGRDQATNEHLYNLYVIAGDQLGGDTGTIQVDGVRDISHVSFFGGDDPSGPPPGLPEGGSTIALLSVALLGFRFFSRRQS